MLSLNKGSKRLVIASAYAMYSLFHELISHDSWFHWQIAPKREKYHGYKFLSVSTSHAKTPVQV